MEKRNGQIISFADIALGYEEFMREWQNEHHRFRSYDPCKKYFDDHYGKEMTGEEAEKVYDECAFRLFSYLLSWGMYRGNDWLIWKSYKVFVKVVEKLFQYKYIDYDPFDPNFSVKEYCNQVLALQKIIYDTLKEVLEEDNKLTTAPKKNEVSPLMVNKIIMGTFGCVIAYDSYDNRALQRLHKFVYGSMKFENSNSEQNRGALLKKTCELISGNLDILEKAVDKTNSKTIKSSLQVKYTVFKVLDMILWEYGKTIADTGEEDD